MADTPPEPLEDIAYLARSANRVRVLEVLTADSTLPGTERGSYPRRGIEEEIDIATTTLSRIITEFEERGWARRNTDGEYESTPTGDLVAEEFGPLLRSVETIHELDEVAALLPIPELTIGVHHFSDATIRRPVGFDANDFGDYLAEFVEDASVFRWMTYVSAPTEVQGPLHERILAGELVSEGVIAGAVVDYEASRIDDPELLGDGPGQVWSEAPGNTWYRYDGHLPCNLFIFDEIVIIENSQSNGVEQGTVIECRNDTVRAWALDLYETYREKSELVDRETFVHG